VERVGRYRHRPLSRVDAPVIPLPTIAENGEEIRPRVDGFDGSRGPKSLEAQLPEQAYPEIVRSRTNRFPAVMQF
jgi:hypothetical protein